MTILIADDVAAIAARMREIASEAAWDDGCLCPRCGRGVIEAKEDGRLQCNDCKAWRQDT